MKKRQRIEESEVNPVSRIHAYGVTKKETWFTYVNERLASVLYFGLMCFCFTIMLMGGIATVYMLKELGIALVTVAALILIYLIPLKKVRKRFFFLRRLSRLCKKKGYKLNILRGSIRSQKKSQTQYDVVVETDSNVWSIRFMTTKKYNSELTFRDANTVKVVHPRPNQTFRVRAMYRPLKTRFFDISFTGSAAVVEGKTTCKAVLLCPVPHTVCVKLPDGAEVPTGTGERFADFTIFTATGFIKMLTRQANSR